MYFINTIDFNLFYCIRKGLKAFNGNALVYFFHLGQFREKYKESGSELKSLISMNKYSRAIDYIDNISKTAAVLEIKPISRYASMISSQLKTRGAVEIKLIKKYDYMMGRIATLKIPTNSSDLQGLKKVFIF